MGIPIMINLVLKSAAYTVATLIVRDSYPTIKKSCIESYDCVCDFLGFNKTSPESNTNTKGAVKQPRNHLTEYQYSVIMDAYELNKEKPKEDRMHQDVLVKRLNDELSLMYTRSGYQHYWRKRTIPNFAKDKNVNER